MSSSLSLQALHHLTPKAMGVRALLAASMIAPSVVASAAVHVHSPGRALGAALVRRRAASTAARSARRSCATAAAGDAAVNTAAPHLPPLLVPSAEEMESLGGALAQGTTAGDVVFLTGDLGAGKTSLCRGFIRGRTGDPRLRVTSPSYLLDQSYETGDEDADPM